MRILSSLKVIGLARGNSQQEFAFGSAERLQASVRLAVKQAATAPDAEILKFLTSADAIERERGFAELRRRVTDDDLRESAVNLLLTAFRPYIVERSVAAINRATRATFSAQDVAQVVCLKLAKRVREGRVELRNIAQFKVLLRTMTQQMALDKLRVKPQPSGRLNLSDEVGGDLLIPAGDPTASAVVSAAELEELVRRHLQPDEWAAFRSRVYDNLDWDAVAAALYPSDAPPERARRANAVRVRLGRALKKLADRLSAFKPLLADKGILPDDGE